MALAIDTVGGWDLYIIYGISHRYCGWMGPLHNSMTLAIDTVGGWDLYIIYGIGH